MVTKVSKAQIEVWEWKERAYESIKDIPKEKRIEFIMKSVQKTIDLIKVRQKSELEQVEY
ncbi:MAG: hypothetical protein A2X61_06345 [Ignavibacteria bacterium GWB2_35_12]|nr:MAG: hypothetical protein A2X63_00155 [Ignavibacteria bacterium GWA2_35_8]OGU37865.1 MAG: hypothetical protein A2X61_06345 [Ignavibacteria bacterium GWB2_35_12]OGU97027.1 MAG: hypothetical protein A2220_11325 [Ignavibacteria bacterium RIFOXYA2_FULL_35_10]OGV18863.1 MAG: hypothetical protein A2475_11240 [Ignavibacteria bacterium RIFOXYC2_FULL_35_21]